MSLVIKSLHKSFGNKIIFENFSYDFPKAGIFVLVGDSGRGKTTLLRLIAGLDKNFKGEITKMSCAYAFQEYRLFPTLNALDNITKILYEKPCESEIREAIELLSFFGFSSEDMKLFPDALSGGMKQRVALCRALLAKKEILLLDEPFSALDYQTRLNVCDDVYKIIRSEKKTSVLITHDISEAVSVADRVFVLTKRPAFVRSSHRLNFDGQEPLKRRENPLFSEWFEKLWKELNV